MGTVIFLTCYLFMLIINDIIVRFYYIINSEKAHSYYTRLIKYMARMAFALPKLYAKFQIKIDNAVKTRLPGVFVIVCNHQSLADIPALVYGFPRYNLKFIAKISLNRGLPMISFGLRMGKHGTIKRTGDFTQTFRELTRISKLTSQRFCPVIFPEGTRSRTGNVLRFHSAAFRRILEDTHLPVVSAVVDGGYKIGNLHKLFTRLKGTKYRLKILSLYPSPQGKRQEIELLRTIHAEIRNQISLWRKDD